MKTLLFITFVNLSVFAQNFSNTHIKKLQSLKELKLVDLEHEFRGCPENSKCSKKTGSLMLKWKKALDIYATKNSIAELKEFIRKHGHPTHSLIRQKELRDEKSILFSSRCQGHKEKNIVRATSFLREWPKNKIHHFNKLKIGNKDYKIPYDTRVIGIKNKNVLIIFNQENTSYIMAYSHRGAFWPIKLTNEELMLLIENKVNLKCEKKFQKNDFYQSLDCYNVYNLTTKKKVKVSQMWSCL